MFDLDQMHDESSRLIAEITERPVPVANGIVRWFDYCDFVAPELRSAWSELRELDFEDDAIQLTEWLSELLTVEPPSGAINGLWFGLFNPVLDDGKPACQMYVGGSTGFDRASDSNEWVCKLSYRPQGGYSWSPVLAQLYRRTRPVKKNVGLLGEAFLCHGYLALLVSNWCHGPMRAKLLGDAPYRAVVMGHDSGDFIEWPC